MARVNLKIARALSRRILEAWKKTESYKIRKKKFELHLTFTSNNIFVNFCNGLGNTFFLKTFGMVGYNGIKRKTRYALFYYGLEAGEQFLAYLEKYKKEHKHVVDFKIDFYLHNALLNKDFRYRRFMDGFLRYNLPFVSFQHDANAAYNGCRARVKRRTRRLRLL